jgi:hypothetical protein
LRITHHLNSDGPISQEDPEVIVMQMEDATQPETPQLNVFHTVTQVQLDRFKTALVLWIVMGHIALSCVENEAFRGLIELLNPRIHEYLYKSGDSVRRLVMDNFIRKKDRIRATLQAARSRIHISFDLWTSPNHHAVLGIIAHFLGEDLTTKRAMLGLKVLQGTHSGENQAPLLIEVVRDFAVAGQIGYFMGDNAGDIDTAIDFVGNELGLQDPRKKRLRCLGHVINLAAKAFLSH